MFIMPLPSGPHLIHRVKQSCCLSVCLSHTHNSKTKPPIVNLKKRINHNTLGQLIVSSLCTRPVIIGRIFCTACRRCGLIIITSVQSNLAKGRIAAFAVLSPLAETNAFTPAHCGQAHSPATAEE